MTATPFLLTAFPLALIAAALSDVRRFIIPNWTSLLLIGGFFIAFLGAALIGDYGLNDLGVHLAVGAGAFLLGFTLWALGLWGGGDGKLIAAAALWFDPDSALLMMAWVAIAGGALALIALAANNWRHALVMLPYCNHIDFEKFATVTPYGVAIAVGALAALPESALFRALTG